MITPQGALQRTIEHREIFYDEMISLMRQIMKGEVSPLMCASILTGLRVKKESIDEITAAATVMREMADKVEVSDQENLLDIVGTGGDGMHTFNISTASMFVIAACGIKVAKHGNRGVSSSSGSADVLESFGIPMNLSAANVGKCIDQVGIGFMFAPNHHSAMKHVAQIRREMGVKTIFNILGPLTNPAQAPYELMGVFHPDLVGIQVRVMRKLGAKRAIVVHGLDGLDEASLGAATMVGELIDGEIKEYEIHPEDYGFTMSHSRNLQVRDAQESRTMIEKVFNNEEGAPRDIVLLNAGLALYCGARSDSIVQGVDMAREAIASGRAKKKLGELVACAKSLAADN